MKKNVQKLLSIVLTVIMMISMLPFSVFASDLDTDMFVEPAVEAVSVPGEEREVESTEEYVLEEAAEIVEESLDEIQETEAADPAAAEDSVENSEEETAVEEVIPEEPAMVGANGSGFPDSFTYNNRTYTKSGDEQSVTADFAFDPNGQTNWEAQGFNGTDILKTMDLYYQTYKSSNYTIVVIEMPSLIQIMEGTGWYISPGSLDNTIEFGYYTALNNFRSVREWEETNCYDVGSKNYHLFENLRQGNYRYGFYTTYSDYKPANPIVLGREHQLVVRYELKGGSGHQADVHKTYKITYKDGLDGQLFEDQIYENEDAVEGHNTPHFKWNGASGDPVRPGYRFMGWKDQEGTEYANSDVVANETIIGNATYTAQWAPNSITVSKEVVVGDGVEDSEINHTIYIALWDGSGYLKKANGEINYKEITVTNGVASGPVVFNENDLLESKDYAVWELAEVADDDPSGLETITVNGKTIHVQVQAYELNEAGEIIRDDNNTHLDTTNTAYIKLTNTYTSDFTSFTLNKQWYDVNGKDVTSSIKDVTATITLYKTASDGETTEAGSIVLDGTADGNGESSAWKAEFTNLNSAYTYKAKETSCSLGYHAYQANDYAQPMGDNDYKVLSGQTIYNLPDRYGIYHSSNGTTEWFAVGENIKLVDKVESGYLYGGYYNYTETGNHKGSALDTYAKTGLDEDFTATENNTIYYLKEVPEAYLRTQAYVTYRKADPKVLRSMWFLTALDADGEYKGFGFIVNGNDMAANSGEELVIKDANGTTIERKTASSITKRDPKLEPTAVIVAADASTSYLTPDTIGQEITVIAYYITPDNVKVTGTQGRTFASEDLTRDTFVHGTLPGTYTVTATTVAASRTLSARKKLTINSAPEEASFTITKVDNGKKVAQTVKEGDNTGKITWAGKTNYVFAGWYEDASYSKAADFSNVKQDMTVYAKYVKASTVKLSFAKKAVKAGEVTLKATLKISNQPDIADTAVECTYKDNAYAVKFTGVKKSSATDTYTGTVKISGLENNSAFTAVISYKTPDGTIVNMSSRTCKYNAGTVTVK